MQGQGARDRVLRCTHPDHGAFEIDFEEFAEGAPETNSSPGGYKWKGGFRGRPALIDALMPGIRTQWSRWRPIQIAGARGDLRPLWRFLDSWESQTGATIETLSDIGDIHGAAWMRQNPPPRRQPYQQARRLLNEARERAHLDPLRWEITPRETVHPPDAKDIEQIKALYHALKRRAFLIQSRWEHADACAAKGRILLGIKRIGRNAPRITEEDAHATYRAIIDLTGNPAPTAKQIGEVLGLKFLKALPKHWPSLVSLQAGLYPTREDVQTLFHLFLVQTGWNPQTALDLDISEANWAIDHGSGPHLKLLQSYKSRSHSAQFCLSPVKSTTSPYRIVDTLVQRTALLRLGISTERCLQPKVATRSPWLYINSRNSEKAIGVLDSNYGTGNANARFLQLVAQEHNEGLSDLEDPAAASQLYRRPKLSEDLRATDLRDAYINQIYLRSGYNWLLAMFAAGHKTLRSLRHYLSRHAYRAHSEARIREFQTNLWKEIEHHKVVDAAILHALCQHGEISAEQRDRWLAKKDRTYVGMGCKDFYHPPRNIEPNHQEGHGCRVQRCTLCHHGILFSDSMPYLSRRRAELEWLRERVPAPTWAQSGFQDELDSLVLNLQNFPRDQIEAQQTFWREQLLSGKHSPLQFGGAYG